MQLLKAGAQVHHVSKDGRSTALHEAVLRNHINIADLLLRASANPFLENAAGELLRRTSTIYINLIRQVPRVFIYVMTYMHTAALWFRTDMCVVGNEMQKQCCLHVSTGRCWQSAANPNMPKQCRLL